MESNVSNLKQEVADSARQVMDSVGLANYVWDIRTDELAWSDNFQALVGIKPGVYFKTGRDFEKLLSVESPETRFGTVLSARTSEEAGSDKDGYAYQCTYAISDEKTEGETTLWIEDTGRWFPGENGKPARAQGLVRIINERRKLEEKMRRQTDFDDLTGLPNRRILQDRMGRITAAALNDGKSCAFMLLSVERLDLVNATYGYETGDEILKLVGEHLAKLLRNGDMVARFSGAKFGILLDNCSGSEVFIAAKRFISGIEETLFKTDAGPVAVKTVIGACLMPRHAKNITEALTAVSIALDEAKRDANMRISLYDPDPGRLSEYNRQASLANNIVEALESSDGMHLAYQPVVDAKHQKVAFHEALLRMTKPDGTVASAGEFIGTAERLGLIRYIDHRALKLSMDILKYSLDAKISLNVSQETAEDPTWISNLASGLANTTDGASRLIVEITESHAAKNLNEARKFVDMVRDLGCKVAIDDFGAGYTSFSNLRHMEVDIIKIDGQFCKNLKSDRQNEVFIRSLLDLANVFDVETVVEWVQDVETAALLSSWGVTYLQGEVFGMPLRVAPWGTSAPPVKIPPVEVGTHIRKVS